ncbi:hypothetical protein BV898_14560 [Hypsibius exemplaris]|uniref:Uncharacterized protein n=1 Tax=Hypsibius exemplaris TaxID=2072580 RepID=A0A9X6RJL6_HYPEX|nr:hypothetical protein BV898_14560 [Hypsibius exemplaris]
MASKGSKSKDNNGSKESSIVSKASSDSKAKGGATSPHASKPGKGKLGAAEKQKLEEENNAREQERLRRASPDGFGICLNDYSELLTCQIDQLSDTCARIFRYSNSGHNHKNAFLDHLYVRALRDFREFAKDEETLKRITHIFLSLLQVFSKEFLDMFEVLDVMGVGYAAFQQPPTPQSTKSMQDVMSYFLETYICNYNLYRFVLTTDVIPIYKVGKVTVRLPNVDPFSDTTLCPLAEAIPQKEEKIKTVPVIPELLPSEKANEKALQGTAVELLVQVIQIAKASEMALEKTAFPSDLDVQFVLERVAKVKLIAFQKEVEEAIRKREHILAEKVIK